MTDQIIRTIRETLKQAGASLEGLSDDYLASNLAPGRALRARIIVIARLLDPPAGTLLEERWRQLDQYLRIPFDPPRPAYMDRDDEYLWLKSQQ